MQVETYETLTFDVGADGSLMNEVVSEEALALIETLGLEGQKALVQVAEVGEETIETRIPYRQTTAEEKAIFATLFPIKTPITHYRGDAIPLRVLQVAAHASACGMDLYVLHPATDIRLNDPVLVGERVVPPSASNGFNGREQYLLARWGDAVESLDVLRAKALPKVMESLRTQARMAVRKFSRVEEDAEEIALAFLNGERTNDDLPRFQSVTLPTFISGRA